MKFGKTIAVLIILLLAYGCYSSKQTDEKLILTKTKQTVLREDFQRYFDSCGVEGSTVVYDIENQKLIVSDTIEINKETLPASTFKIINLLIALETEVIKDEYEVIKWIGTTDTIKYGYRPDIYHDMSVKDAFESSAGWVFIELAKKIGKAKYEEYLVKCNYGNNNLTQAETDFWNFGGFGISPISQIEFLHSLYKETLPFSKRNIDIVKKVMMNEQTQDYSISAKTGWTRENNINTGWWIGYIETEKGTYIFATRLLQDRKMNRPDFGICRKEITKKIWGDLQIIVKNQ